MLKSLTSLRPPNQDPKVLGLLTLGGLLIAIHLSLSWHEDDSDFLGLSLIVWFAVINLLQRKTHQLVLVSQILPSLLGASLIGIVLLRSFNAQINPGLTIIPLLGGLGLALLASGFAGLKIYWRELLILSLLAVPRELGYALGNVANSLALLTAKLSGFFLWYLGATVSVVGNTLRFPEGDVVITEACAGVSTLLYLLKVALIFLLLFPLSQRLYAWLVPFFALGLALGMNILRIAILAVLSPTNVDSFTYWHEGEGSNLFSLISVILFGSFYLFLMRQDRLWRSKKKKPTEAS